MSRRRPWRAVAWVTDWTTPTGTRPEGRVAACTKAGLDAWVRERTAAGQHVQVWQVPTLPLPGENPDTPPRDRSPSPVA
jgi:hypothetical protein